MPIIFHKKTKEFHLYNEKISYIFKILANGHPGHIYYGRRLTDRDSFGGMIEYALRDMAPCAFEGNSTFSLEHLQQEYPSFGSGDMRFPAFELERQDGSRVVDFKYQKHEIYAGKKKLPGLPAVYVEKETEAQTLEVTLEDAQLGARIVLSYTIFEAFPVIARNTCFYCGREGITLLNAMSGSLDLPDKDYEMVELAGAWSRERHVHIRPLAYGIQSIYSLRGCSSHQFNPFLALKRKNADEHSGEVIGASLIYSGDFLAQVEVDNFDVTRLIMGIHPNEFRWELRPGEYFQTPEMILAYSENGLNGMSQTFHKLYRTRLARGKWRDKARPILINNWEATYFDFNEEKILALAQKAAEIGIELFVLDDGWFGCRDTDDNSLGDWAVNEKKLPGGLKYLADQINALGMKFGLWVEPEMVSPNSDLYRAHPDYALQIPGRKPMEARHQLVLDISRPEVRDCVYAQLKAALSSANIEYVKWDMNRSLTDVASFCLEADRQGELFHRYVLGVYELQERLLADFPGLLLENCCSGGGRFDPGMLYYSPQIWTSDNTDAVDRLRIQEGTALIYPLSSMGAHVAACPSHTNGRVTPFATRGLVSLPGCFGYELDLTKLTEEELAMIPGQLENYRKYGPVFHGGDYYRLASYGENGEYDALMSVSKDKRTAVLDYVHVMSRQRRRSVLLPLRGLDEETLYRSSETGEVRSGAGWMYGGMVMPCMTGDSTGKLIVLEAV